MLLTDNVRSSQEWLPVAGFELLYSVSRWGQAYSAKRDIFLRPGTDKYGYLYVVLYKDGKRYNKKVHSIVMETFVGPRPESKEINHKDGNKKNNCVENLEYVTQSKNTAHAYSIGLRSQVGVFNNNTVLNGDKIRAIRERSKQGETYKIIADDYGVSESCIGHIIRRENWKKL